MAETLRELVVALSPELKRSKARPRRLRMRRRWFCRAARAIWRQPGAVRIDGVDRDCGPQGRCPGGVIRVAARWAVLRSRKRGERVIRNKRRAEAKQGTSASIENAEAHGSAGQPRRFLGSLAQSVAEASTGAVAHRDTVPGRSERRRHPVCAAGDSRRTDGSIGSAGLPRRFCDSLAHEGNRRNEYAGLPAPAGMGCHTGAGKEKVPAALH